MKVRKNIHILSKILLNFMEIYDKIKLQKG